MTDAVTHSVEGTVWASGRGQGQQPLLRVFQRMAGRAEGGQMDGRTIHLLALLVCLVNPSPMCCEHTTTGATH